MIILLPLVLIAFVQGDSLNQPMVAFLCNKPPVFLENGQWTIAEGQSCPPKTEDILNFCHKVYPGRDINNVVEYGEKVRISGWCEEGKKSCNHPDHSVEPYLCMEGKFKSKALMVPEHCIFDHIYGSSDCKTEPRWKQEAKRSCRNRDTRMDMTSFAILAPCPNTVSAFRGVEFVCCPPKSSQEVLKSTGKNDVLFEDEDEDYEDESAETEDSDEGSDEDSQDLYEDRLNKLFEDDDEEESHTTRENNEPVARDSEENDVYTLYLKNSPGRYLTEHEYFGRAKTDLQKLHHEKVTKMMKEWASARQHVQELKTSDPKAAEDLNREITFRFQKTYEALEQEGLAEKKQLTTLHQQRIQSYLNERKRRAMEKYMEEINRAQPDSSAILHTLKHYVRTEEKDRLHSLNHFKHVRDTYPTDARPIRSQVLEHMRIIQERVNQALDMLNRVPNYHEKIQDQIEEFLQTFHELDVGVNNILVKPYEELDESPEEGPVHNDNKVTDEDDDDEVVDPAEPARPVEKIDIVRVELPLSTTVDDEDREDEHDYERVQGQPAHIQTNDFNVAQKSYSNVEVSSTNNFLPTGGVLGIAVASITVFVIVVAGIVVLRKRAARIPGDRGFVEVDQGASPEERHVANMQINGYENPTYKYFETSATNA